MTKRAVVTGGGGGLGRAFALELAKRGAKVLVADVDEGAANDTAEQARREGASEAFAMRVDVAKVADVEAMAKEADARFGGTDLLVNNAGVAVSGAVGDVPLDDWRWIVDINLWGVIYGCHVFVPRMKKQGSGAIINVASAAGLLSAPQMGPYNVTKAGVVALSETLYGELSDLGLGVTVLCPTFFRTNIHKAARGSDEKMRGVVEKLMDKSKVDANGVARLALEASDKKQLFVIPQADGRWLWRAKRSAPGVFYRGMGAIYRKRFAKTEG